MKLEKILYTGMLAGFTTSMYFGVINPMNESHKIKKEFNSVYEQALFQHATDRNNIIFPSKQKEFDARLLEGKEVITKKGYWPRYNDGKLVPVETVIEWIKDYKKENS